MEREASAYRHRFAEMKVLIEHKQVFLHSNRLLSSIQEDKTAAFSCRATWREMVYFRTQTKNRRAQVERTASMSSGGSCRQTIEEEKKGEFFSGFKRSKRVFFWVSCRKLKPGRSRHSQNPRPRHGWGPAVSELLFLARSLWVDVVSPVPETLILFPKP